VPSPACVTTMLAVGLKPSARQGEARLRGRDVARAG